MNPTRIPRRTAVPLLAAGALLSVPAVAGATTVEPLHTPGNPSCLDLGYDHELKFDPPSAGSKSGGGVTVDLWLGSDQYGQLVSWSSSKPIDAVVVKGGPNANAYVYAGESSGDTGLHAPFNGPEKYYGLSHVNFCWDDEEPPAEEPPAEQPPGDQPPPVTPPAITPPATPSARPKPTTGVLGKEIVSGRSQLRGPSGCVGRKVRAKVSGRQIAKVVFSLDGRRVKTIKGAGAYSVRSSTLSAGVHRIKAKVTYKAASRTRARSHVLTFQRCVVRQVAPRFAG